MMRRATETIRIVPPRLAAFAGLGIALWSLALIGWLGLQFGGALPWPFVLFAVVLLTLAVVCIAQSLPGSPIDFLELGPSGLTVGGLFGRRHRRWQDIERFSVFLLPMRSVPLVRVKAICRSDSVADMGFSMGGYVKLGWFDDIQDRQRDLSDWFEHVKATYTGGNRSGTLPETPGWFVGRMTKPPLSRRRIAA